MIFEGKVWKFGDKIDTDLMAPGGAVMSKPGISDEEASKFCMSTNRPGWSAQVQNGDLIIAGNNWGCGSGRPAARLLKALGISIIVSDSMSRLFFRNAINTGLPVLICKGVSAIFEEGDLASVNLETGEVKNLTKKTSIKGEALPKGSPPMEIIMKGGLLAYLQQEFMEENP